MGAHADSNGAQAPAFVKVRTTGNMPRREPESIEDVVLKSIEARRPFQDNQDRIRARAAPWKKREARKALLFRIGQAALYLAGLAVTLFGCGLSAWLTYSGIIVPLLAGRFADLHGWQKYGILGAVSITMFYLAGLTVSLQGASKAAKGSVRFIRATTADIHCYWEERKADRAEAAVMKRADQFPDASRKLSNGGRETKTCERCGSRVSIDRMAGEYCPFCCTKWADVKTTIYRT